MPKHWHGDNQQFRPRPELRPYFTQYRSIVGRSYTEKSRPFTIFPDGKSHLLYHLFLNPDQPEGTFNTRFSLVGPRSVFQEINRRHRLLTLIFSFRPSGAYSFFSFPMREIADLSVNLVDLWGSKAKECQEEITRWVLLGELDAAVQATERYLLRQLDLIQRLRIPHPILRQSLEVLQQQPRISIGALANKYGISTRYLHQLFTRQIGINAKRFCRIQRAKNTLEKAQAGWSYGWADLAIASGYYDQSHMIDEFQSLLGASPAQMLRK